MIKSEIMPQDELEYGMKAKQLKVEIENVFMKYGLTNGTDCDYLAFVKRIDLQSRYYGSSSKGKERLMNSFSQRVGTLQIVEYRKYFKLVIPDNLEDKFKEMINHFHYKFMLKHKSFRVGVLKKSPTLSVEYGDILSYISQTWDLKKIFVSGEELEKLAIKELFRYIRNNSYHIFNLMQREITNILAKYVGEVRNNKKIFFHPSDSGNV